jgi:hypothetical protein
MEMKKILGLLLVALIGFAMMAGGACASTLDIATAGAVALDADADAASTGPYVVGSEWLAGQAGVVDVDLGSAIPTPGGVAAVRSDILYTPSIALGVNSTIVITVTNGAIAPSAIYGLYRVAGVAGQVASLVDFTANAAGNYTSMTFKMTVATILNDVLALTKDGLVPAAGNRPVLRFTNAQLVAGNMTLQVTAAYDDTSLPLVAPTTAAEVVAKETAQLSAKVRYLTGAGVYADGNATSVINVEATPVARSKFVVEGAQDTPTTTTSTAAILVSAATVNNGIVVANAAYTITFTGDQTAIKATTGVQLSDGAATSFIRGVGQWTVSSTFAAHDLVTPGSNDITITVDGTTIINTASYSVTLLIDPAEAGVANQTSLSSATAFVWTVNGWQATVPYHWAAATQAEDTFIKIFNNSTTTGNVSADVTPDGGGTVTISLGSIPAGTIGIFWANAIATAAGVTIPGSFAAVYTVNAPQANVTAMAVQKRSGGSERVLPVYTGAPGAFKTW